MRAIYSSTSKNDAELQAKLIAQKAEELGKPLHLDIKQENGKWIIYANGMLTTRTDVIYFKEDLNIFDNIMGIRGLPESEDINIDGSLKFLMKTFLHFGHRAIKRTLERKLEEGFNSPDLLELREICYKEIDNCGFGERVKSDVKKGVDILITFLDSDTAYLKIFQRMLNAYCLTWAKKNIE